jgi:ferredoxin
MAVTRKIVHDPTACVGHGLCADLLPELIELDEWGYPILLAGNVPQWLIRHARRAVSACPTLALRLRPVPRESGPGESGPGESGPGEPGPGESGPGESGPGEPRLGEPNGPWERGSSHR